MFRHKLSIIAILLLLPFSAVTSFGWDETGHKIAAYIAWQQMRPDVRDKVIKILLSAPEDAQLSTFYMGYGSQTQEERRIEFFLIAATWPDIIKDRNYPVRFKKYNNSDWHYFDNLWTDKSGKVELLPAGDDGGKLMEKLPELDKVIRGTATNPEKAVAIAWLEHLIGDIHQPLHVTGRVTADQPKGDQGGNLFSLTPKGTSRDKADNLHRFWDGVIDRTVPNSKDLCDTDYLVPIAKEIIKKYPYAKLQDRIADGKFDVWEKEGVDLTAAEVYKGLTLSEPPSNEYKKKAFEIAQERIAFAGYRMGDLFNEVFGAAVSTPTVNK
jgi:hypothetical protein